MRPSHKTDLTSTYADTFSRLAFPILFHDMLHIHFQMGLGGPCNVISHQIDIRMTQVHKPGAPIVARAAVVDRDANVMESLNPF